MDFGAAFAKALTPIVERLIEHERRIGAGEWRGKVTDVDPAKGLARIEIAKDEDGNPVKGPWLPYSQVAGGLKAHIPPTVGQTMTIRASTGDLEQGTLDAFHWSDSNQSPSSEGDANVITFGSVTIRLTGGGVTITAGGVTFDFSGAGFVQNGGKQEHDGKNVGSDHKHVSAPDGPPGVPL